MKNIYTYMLLLVGTIGFAQTGIGTVAPNVDSDLELGSTDRGLLLNRVALVALNNPAPLVAHEEGMMVYNTTVLGELIKGLYYNTGAGWRPFTEPVVPSGVIQAFTGGVIPAGWILCDGQVLDRTLYSGLFATIGEVYGIGDGSTTFNVPDLTGHFVRGVNVAAGRALGSFQEASRAGFSFGRSPAVHLLPTGELSMSFSNTFPASTQVDSNLENITNVPFTGNNPYKHVSNKASTSAMSYRYGDTHPSNRAMNYIIKF